MMVALLAASVLWLSLAVLALTDGSLGLGVVALGGAMAGALIDAGRGQGLLAELVILAGFSLLISVVVSGSRTWGLLQPGTAPRLVALPPLITTAALIAYRLPLGGLSLMFKLPWIALVIMLGVRTLSTASPVVLRWAGSALCLAVGVLATTVTTQPLWLGLAWAAAMASGWIRPVVADAS